MGMLKIALLRKTKEKKSASCNVNILILTIQDNWCYMSPKLKEQLKD